MATTIANLPLSLPPPLTLSLIHISFIKAKGFYIALALCITGAGTAAWLTAQNTISGIREQQQKPPAVTEQGEGNQWDYEDILQQQTGGEANTPKPSLPTSPSTAPENPSPTQSAAADAPQPPAKSEPAAPLCFCLPVDVYKRQVLDHVSTR